MDTDPSRFGDAPRRQPFAADSILEFALALGHQHAHPIARQQPRQRCAAQSAAHDNYVEVSHCRTPEPD
jgi:hypothetical protein